MKKYLLIFMGVLSFFFFSDSVSALSFNMNGEETTVNEENYIYYFYTLQPELFEEYDYFLSFMNSDGSYRFAFTNDKPMTDSNSHFTLGQYFYITKDTYYCRYTNTFTLTSCEMITKSISYSIVGTHSYFYNFDIYDNRIPGFSTANITKDEIYDAFSTLSKYIITYYVNNELYQVVEVEEGTSHILLDYLPPENYLFNGWEYDSSIDLSNITSNVNIYGTTSYVRPDMNYSEDIDSIIHELSVSIIGKNVPVEFDYVYTVMDFIILLVLVFCVVMPFVLVIKLLSGRW